MTWSSHARGLWRHLRKFMTVGAGSAAVDLIVYSILASGCGWAPHAANLISRPCGGLFGFAFNKVWTFNLREARGTGRQFAKYWTTWLATYALSGLLIWAFHRFGRWGALPAKLAAEGVIFAGNFLVMRYWTFRPPRRP